MSSFLLPRQARAQCPTGNVTLSTQAQVDAFPPGCTNLTATLTISGRDITNLNGLNKLQSVGGVLLLDDNPQLTSIAALTALTTVGSRLQISNDRLLASLDGLNKLQSVGGGLEILNDPQLTSIAALTALTRVNGILEIANNALLASLDGLNNIQSVGGGFTNFKRPSVNQYCRPDGLNQR